MQKTRAKHSFAKAELIDVAERSSAMYMWNAKLCLATLFVQAYYIYGKMSKVISIDDTRITHANDSGKNTFHPNRIN